MSSGSKLTHPIKPPKSTVSNLCNYNLIELLSRETASNPYIKTGKHFLINISVNAFSHPTDLKCNTEETEGINFLGLVLFLQQTFKDEPKTKSIPKYI